MAITLAVWRVLSILALVVEQHCRENLMSANCIEYITIVGNTFEEVTAECRAQQLSEKQFAIVTPIQRHRFTIAGRVGEAGKLNGQNVVSATFARRT